MSSRKSAFETTSEAIGTAKLSITGKTAEEAASKMSITIPEQIALNLAMQTDILSSISASSVLRTPQTLKQFRGG
jgi:hypothetical protein